MALKTPNSNNFKESIYSALGQTFYNLSEYKKAIEQFKKSLEVSNSSTRRAETYKFMATSYFIIEEYLDATKYYEESLKLNPSDKDVLYNLAFSLFKSKKIYEANDKLKLLYEIDSEFEDINNLRPEIENKIKEFEKAVRTLEK